MNCPPIHAGSIHQRTLLETYDRLLHFLDNKTTNTVELRSFEYLGNPLNRHLSTPPLSELKSNSFSHYNLPTGDIASSATLRNTLTFLKASSLNSFTVSAPIFMELEGVFKVNYGSHGTQYFSWCAMYISLVLSKAKGAKFQIQPVL